MHHPSTGVLRPKASDEGHAVGSGNIETAANQNGNYPAEIDSTSSGGWGSSVNTFSERNQRSGVRADAGRDTWEDRGGPLADEFTKGPMETEGNRSKPPKTGLIDQSTSGGNLKNEMQDARQGRDDRWPSGNGDDIGA
ncbi:hypothetical protein BKA70DRAFT_1310439 [Coprinopsis sp. MPI-PUGE-AT-0042]|nr:hypothetical protein BKA70DRAFT_1310439 [Coprinopsis sp. MPI-PUGE-AT-0042]